MFRDSEARLLVSDDFTFLQTIFRIDFSWSLLNDICFVTFSKVLQIYLVSYKSNMQFICAFAVVNGLNQLYSVVETVFICNGIYDKKCVCPSDIFVNLRCITLKWNTPIMKWNTREERQWRNGLSRERLYLTWLPTEWRQNIKWNNTGHC